METESAWLAPAPQLFRALQADDDQPKMRGLEGLGHALHQVMALRLMCDPRDLCFTVQPLGGEAPEKDEATMRLGLFFYEAHAGGVGLAEQAFQQAHTILEDAKALIAGCPCRRGCPSCIGPVDEQGPPIKAIALALGRGLTGLAAV